MRNYRNSRRRKPLTIKAIATIVIISLMLGGAFVLVSDTLNKQIYPIEYSDLVEKYSAEYGVPRAIVYAVIKAESSFDRYAVSHVDPPAIGLMQLMEETYTDMARLLGDEPNPSRLYDPETNIKYGVYYLSYLYRRFENWENTLAAYNAGPGNVYKMAGRPRIFGWQRKSDLYPIPRDPRIR